MRTSRLGPLRDVSRLTLGGGGIGQVWGETSRDEASATIRLAVDSGITALDTAPIYGNCEAIIGETFGGRLPDGLKITSKCGLGTCAPAQVLPRLAASLEASLAAMQLDRIDLFFLHSNIAADDFVFAHGDSRRDEFSTKWSLYADHLVPAFERLQREGRIGAWGITGVGVPESIVSALRHTPKPQAVQVVTNLLDSPGGMRRYAGAARPRDIIDCARTEGVGVMGIRAVQAGALTATMDRNLSPSHPDAQDYVRAAPFRELCRSWSEDPAMVAHRYALSMQGVDTLVLGVKNRVELRQALDAEAAGPLQPAQVDAIDALGLRAS
jgi:aryl-alcohol dehydrogenase-like predicted oxidoreductase